jgi:hypothetical protein
MYKVRKKKMFLVISILLVGVIAIFIWFKIPYSPVKSEFQKDIDALISNYRLEKSGEVFAQNDFSDLPIAVQKYVENCGYIGTPKMSYLKMEYDDVAFMQGRNGPALTIDYQQYDFVKEPCRMALIDSRLFGVPFEGYDYYQNGKGGMKGVIAKAITLFDQKGTEMDKACLATFLAESMFAPTILLQEYITLEEISAYETKAIISYNGISTTGIFTFNEQYEMISFTTNDRSASGTDGTVEYVPWSALCSDYRFTDSGIKYPTKFKCVWNYPDEDFIYFDGLIREISYDYSQRP